MLPCAFAQLRVHPGFVLSCFLASSLRQSSSSGVRIRRAKSRSGCRVVSRELVDAEVARRSRSWALDEISLLAWARTSLARAGREHDSPLDSLVLIGSSVALGAAVQTSNGAYSVAAFVLVALAFVLAMAPAFLRTTPDLDVLIARRMLLPALAIALGCQFVLLAAKAPAIYLQLGGTYSLSEFRVLLAVAAVASGIAVARSEKGVWWLAPFLLFMYAAIGAWTLAASPRPRIDVFSIHQDSIAALLEGRNPYTLTFANPYHSTKWYSPGAATHDRLLFGYVYPAWTLLLAVPGYVLAHDYRYSFLAATAASAALAVYARRSPWALVALLLFLFTPRSFFVLEQGWTEPALLTGVALTIFAACRRSQALLAIGLGIVACAKQYSVVAAPAVLLLRPMFPNWRSFGVTLLKAMGVAFVVTLPLVLWGPKPYWHNVFGMQFSAPFRTDSLSILVFWLRAFGHDMPRVLRVGLPLLLGTITVLRAPRTPSGFAWAGGTLYFIFFLFHQGFCNYYYLVIALYAVTVAVAEPHVGGRVLENAGGRQWAK